MEDNSHLWYGVFGFHCLRLKNCYWLSWKLLHLCL